MWTRKATRKENQHWEEITKENICNLNNFYSREKRRTEKEKELINRKRNSWQTEQFSVRESYNTQNLWLHVFLSIDSYTLSSITHTAFCSVFCVYFFRCCCCCEHQRISFFIYFFTIYERFFSFIQFTFGFSLLSFRCTSVWAAYTCICMIYIWLQHESSDTPNNTNRIHTTIYVYTILAACIRNKQKE